jgi:hypothetical protein
VQGLVDTPGHFYVVAVLNTGEMQLFWRNDLDRGQDLRLRHRPLPALHDPG